MTNNSHPSLKFARLRQFHGFYYLCTMRNLMYFFLCLIAFSCVPKPQNEVDSNPEESIFPDSWSGVYQGELLLYRNGIVSDTNTMELKVYRINIDSMAFHIKYGTDSFAKEYTIFPGKADNQWIMDEHNSILLDHYYLEDELSCTFSVNESLLHATYRKEGKSIVSTIRTFPMKYIRITGDTVPYDIKSYREQIVQKAVLRKIN